MGSATGAAELEKIMNARYTQELMQSYAQEVIRLREALEQIERLARWGTRDGHLIRDAIQEIAAKAIAD